MARTEALALHVAGVDPVGARRRSVPTPSVRDAVTGLEEILADARTGNQARDVTGALIYVDGVFFQIIEGDKDVVQNLMANIARDSRHHSVKVFYEAEVDVRAFASWSMAVQAKVSKSQALQAEDRDVSML